MLLQILKKDLKNRKGINTILFIFITLATVFLASSIHNILTVSTAVGDYLEYANVPDVFILTSSDQEKAEISNWLDEKQSEQMITDWEYERLFILPTKTLYKSVDGSMEEIDAKGASLYASNADARYNRVYDSDGSEIKLAKGEVAVSNIMASHNDLAIGDTILLKNKGETNAYVVKYLVKDATFGNEMASMMRVLFTQEDLQKYTTTLDTFGLYDVKTPQSTEFTTSISDMKFQSILNKVTKDMYWMIYAFDMIVAGLLIAIGTCLILIALLVLRFTLTFTMEEQYQEIGIMKAIGLRNFAIKKLYLTKYLFIVLAGSLLGFFISIPISEMSIQSVSTNMIMRDTESNIISNVLCTIFIIVLVLAFCYFCTRKLNKISAIAAIHGGEQGERWHGYRGLRLSKRAHMRIPTYLGLNDILHSMRRYLVLIITFCISFILITIPLNTLNTMGGKEMIRRFMLDPDSAVYVSKVEGSGTISTAGDLIQRMEELAIEVKDAGYDVHLSSPALYFFHFEGKQNKGSDILTVQILGEDSGYAAYELGSAPKLENEIAFSKQIMKKHGWKIGDTVTTTIDGENATFIITGTYSDYTQMGESARLNPAFDCGNEFMFDYHGIMVGMDTEKTQSEVKEEMSSLFPDYTWSTAEEELSLSIGGIKDTLDQMVLPMTALLCGIIMLITLLMEKLFITREKGEIAMLKSIGFQRNTILRWQMMRMFFVVLSSLLISIPLSLLSNAWVLKPIFALMGAEMDIEVQALDVYVIYPLILLCAILCATWIGTRAVTRIDIREMNNLE